MSNNEVSKGFRHAMRRLATTVAIISTGRDDGWAGMAATAVMSVCTSPPTLLIAVNRSASIHPVLCTEHAFCVNLLTEEHHELVGIFSGQKKGRERFEHGDWINHRSGLPLLRGALSSLVCRVTQRLDAGTHTLFLGEVDEVLNHEEILPLIWVDGHFASVAR